LLPLVLLQVGDSITGTVIYLIKIDVTEKGHHHHHHIHEGLGVFLVP
jgi:hypothetical protein